MRKKRVVGSGVPFSGVSMSRVRITSRGPMMIRTGVHASGAPPKLIWKDRARMRWRNFKRDVVIGTIIGAGTVVLGKKVVEASFHPKPPEPTAPAVLRAMGKTAPGSNKDIVEGAASRVRESQARAVEEAKNRAVSSKPAPQSKKPVEKPARQKRPAAKASRPGPLSEISRKMSVSLSQGEPCLSADFIDAFLRRNGSPAHASAADFVRLGRKFGVRPSIILAFFGRESNWGKNGIARETKSVGNIKYTPTSGSGVKYTNFKGFRKYEAWADGIQDFCWLLTSRHYAGEGRTTIEGIVPEYDPKKAGGNPEKYIADLLEILGGIREMTEWPFWKGKAFSQP